MSYEFKPADGATKDRVRKGRGNASGKGGESGRGHKGQKSRSGYSYRSGFEGGQMPLYRRVPKKNGFKNINRVTRFVLNLDDINRLFQNGDIVSPEALIEKGLVSKNEISKSHFKVLGDGELAVKVIIRANSISKSALSQLEKTGSQFELLA